MPTKIIKPSIDDITLLDTIVQERQRGVNASYFTSFKSTWQSRYNEYIGQLGNPELILSLNINDDDAKKFINLYEDKPKSILSDIIEPLKNHQLTLCPFCSEAGRPNTLDHFLPKSKFPEYSILSHNLIPACDACQKADAKGNKILNSKNKRIFLHPYYDIPNNIHLIELEIFPPYDKGYNYKLKINKTLNPHFKKHIRRHLKELNIYQRFNEFYSGEFIRKRDLIKDIINDLDELLARKATLDEIKKTINKLYEKEKKISINYWDTIIYKAFIDNDNLLNFILNRNVI